VEIRRGDGSRLMAREAPGGTAITLVNGARHPLATALLTVDSGSELVQWVNGLFEQHPEDVTAVREVTHFPPRGELERTILTVAYLAYRPELDALAREGVHAYVEGDGTALRIFGDLAPSLLLDVSLDDAGGRARAGRRARPRA
jgi:hypothetical protein